MKILLAVASYQGIFDAEGKPRCLHFAKSLADSMTLLQERGYEVDFSEQIGNCYIQTARNELVAHGYATGADVTVFLDDDVEWPAEDLLRLIEMPDEVVAGVYRRKKDNEDYPVHIRTLPDQRPMVRADGCISATHVPTGFLAIKRSAVEKLHEALPERKYAVYVSQEKTGEYYDLFPQGIGDGLWWGEDFAFCNLWRSIGGLIWVVPDITLTHWRGSTPYSGNYHNFLLRCPGGSEAVEHAVAGGQ